jgi:hypothetical protein
MRKLSGELPRSSLAQVSIHRFTAILMPPGNAALEMAAQPRTIWLLLYLGVFNFRNEKKQTMSLRQAKI